jgi:PEP-CTERM motif
MRLEEGQMAGRNLWHTIVIILAVMAVVIPAVAVTPAHVVLKQGDAMGLSSVRDFGQAFVDGNGKVGFVGELSDNQSFVWHDTGPIFLSGSAGPNVLFGWEESMGVSNVGGFIYSPSFRTPPFFNPHDSVYTHNGKLLADDDPAPNIPGRFSTFNSRPRMFADGTAVWVGGTTATLGGSSTGRVAYRCADTSNVNSCMPVLKTGDLVGGLAIAANGIDFGYDYSNNGGHYIQELLLTTDSANDNRIWVDGSIVATEGTSTGGADNWSSFFSHGINESGNHIFAADTTAAVIMDMVLTFNGLIKAREGDIIDDTTLGSSIQGASINDLNVVATIWNSSKTETLFLWSDLNANPLGGMALLSVNDTIDVNNDTIADYAVTDFNADATSTSGLDLGNDGYIYVEVDMTPIGGGASVQAIIQLTPEPGSLMLLAVAMAAFSLRKSR